MIRPKKYGRSILVLIAVLLCASSCNTEDTYRFKYETDAAIKKLAQEKDPHYPDVRFIVWSDPHYFAPELGTEGSAFQEYLNHDRKMLKESSEILESAINDIAEASTDFVIICGDLTKDGEAESHRTFASLLETVVQQGTAVFVVPGNHDINNGESYRYQGDSRERVSTIDEQMFMDIYHDYGFASSIHQDPDSLSYIAEPVEGLWVFAMDSCRYRENSADEHPITDGRFSPHTLQWLEDKLIEALQLQKAVIGFMHHGIREHYDANEKYYGDYLLDDFEPISKMFAAYGMRFVFTGHFHAQDITITKWASDIPEHFLFDIETGSLVTYPVPWRLATIENQLLDITSSFVQSIKSHPDDFKSFALTYVTNGTMLLADEALAEYGVPEVDQDKLSPQIAAAYVAHLQGDETAPDRALDFTDVGPLGGLVGMVQGDLIEGWYHDLAPPDNNLIIDMSNGEYFSQ